VLQTSVALELTVAGTVESFDRASFTARLASSVGVPPEDITLSVTAASVKVVATILVAGDVSSSSVVATVQQLANNATDLTEALVVTIESIAAPVVSLLIVSAPSPPPPSPPPPPPPLSPKPSPPTPSLPVLEDTADSIEKCDTICIGGTSVVEWYILFGRLGVTLFIVSFACFSRKVAKMSAGSILSVLVAAADALSDVAFTAQRLGIMNTTADQVTAFLLLSFLLLPVVASARQLRLVFHLPDLDGLRLRELPTFYAFLMFVALSNMELLRLLPWRPGAELHDGLPDRRLMLSIWLAVILLEDIPQLAIQITVLVIGGFNGLLAPLSIAFSASSIVWRGLRKSIYLVPTNRLHVTTTSSPESMPTASADEVELQPKFHPPLASAYPSSTVAADPLPSSPSGEKSPLPAYSHEFASDRANAAGASPSAAGASSGAAGASSSSLPDDEVLRQQEEEELARGLQASLRSSGLDASSSLSDAAPRMLPSSSFDTSTRTSAMYV
jgi:hypothetical protein